MVAFDKSKPKKMQIEKLAKRLGVFDIIDVRVQDSTKVDIEPESFDKILIDAPCSSLGKVSEDSISESRFFCVRVHVRVHGEKTALTFTFAFIAFYTDQSQIIS